MDLGPPALANPAEGRAQALPLAAKAPPFRTGSFRTIGSRMQRGTRQFRLISRLIAALVVTPGLACAGAPVAPPPVATDDAAVACRAESERVRRLEGDVELRRAALAAVEEELVSSLRGRGGSELFPRGSAARSALRALRDGKIFALIYDQNCRREEGVFVPFFGRLACTRSGPPRIAMHTGAPVLPVFAERLAGGMRHRVRIHPPLEILPAGEDREAAIRENARRMTQVIEEEIRRVPDHWIWGHRRWRTQPKGEPKPYPSRRRSLIR